MSPDPADIDRLVQTVFARDKPASQTYVLAAEVVALRSENADRLREAEALRAELAEAYGKLRLTNESYLAAEAELAHARQEAAYANGIASKNATDAAQARQEAEALREALQWIDAVDVDWRVGVDENVERLKDIARAALAQHGQPSQQEPA
jgi:hypothetical protein